MNMESKTAPLSQPQQEPDAYRITAPDGYTTLMDAPMDVKYWQEKLLHTVRPLYYSAPIAADNKNQPQNIPVPDGWQLVPRQPTPQMIEDICAAGTNCIWPSDYSVTAQEIRRGFALDGYIAALAAAPSPDMDKS